MTALKDNKHCKFLLEHVLLLVEVYIRMVLCGRKCISVYMVVLYWYFWLQTLI